MYVPSEIFPTKSEILEVKNKYEICNCMKINF